MLKNGSLGTLFVALSLSAVGLVTVASAQASIWMPCESSDYIRTYDGVNLSVKLETTICPNEKNYFYVTQSVVAETKSSAAIAIAAKFSGQLIPLRYEVVGTQHCHVHGIELRY